MVQFSSRTSYDALSDHFVCLSLDHPFTLLAFPSHYALGGPEFKPYFLFSNTTLF